MALLDTVKKVAAQTNEVNVPAAFMFGSVTSLAPLTIRVDNRFDIFGDAIVLMKEFRAGAYSTHVHGIAEHGHTVAEHSTISVAGHNHTVPATTTQEAADHSHLVAAHDTQVAEEHSHAINQQDSGQAGAHAHGIDARNTEDAGAHDHGIAARDTGLTGLTTKPETYFGLAVGDNVVLLRNQGGQSFLVLGRL